MQEALVTMSMDARVVVITGASEGIGAALARELGRSGSRLVLAARRGDALEAVGRETGAECLSVVTDVRKSEDVFRLRDRALERFGRVDVWVNNAGRGIAKAALELTPDELDEMMSINVKSALYGMQAIIPYFEKVGAGQVINVSSFLGRVPVASFRSAYSAAKAALNSLTANVRMDLRARRSPVHVTLVMPGPVDTAFAKNVLGDSVPPFQGGFPAQSAEEVAHAIVSVIENPVAEMLTNPNQIPIVKSYYDDVAAFEARVVKPLQEGVR